MAGAITSLVERSECTERGTREVHERREAERGGCGGADAPLQRGARVINRFGCWRQKHHSRGSA
jgi:hypothetical protein